MFWSLSLHLLPGERILEDSTNQSVVGLKPTYSVHLSNKRVLFRFDGLGSSMTQSFLYSEIIGAGVSQRMFIDYLALRTSKKEYFLHTPEPAYWVARILDCRSRMSDSDGTEPAAEPTARRRNQDLAYMLTVLRKHAVLTEAEYEEKLRLVEAREP